jgi:hypothetical protein
MTVARIIEKPWCQGSWLLDTACGKCERCLDTAKVAIDELRKKGISRHIAQQLTERYAALDALRSQIAIANHQKMPNERVRLFRESTNPNYNFDMHFSWEELIAILTARREAILDEIQALGGERL